MSERGYLGSYVKLMDGEVRAPGRSYPINGIGSVHVQRPNRRGYITLAVIVGLVALVSTTTGPGPGTIVLWLAVAALIFGAITRPYVLVLKTASGDQQALKSRKLQFLHTIKHAIEEAVAQRG